MTLLLDIDSHFFNQPFWGETVGDYCWFAGIILGTLLLKKPIALALSNIGHNIASRISKEQHVAVFRELLRKPIEWLAVLILFYIAITRLSEVLDNVIIMHRNKGLGNILDIRLGDVTDHIFLLFIIVAATLVLSRTVDFVYFVQNERARQNDNQSRQQLLPLVKEMIKLLVWAISFFWMLGSVFHVNIPALITGLGIGGIAIALAAKESVENFFAAFTLLSDRPFQVGDTIRIGNYQGAVERIGFRSSRLRSADGSAFIIPNQKLVSENLENLTDRMTSGVHMVINIKYGVPYEQLQQMVAALKEMIAATTHVQDPINVSLDGFLENVFQLNILYHLPYPIGDATTRQVKQEINMKAYDIVSRYTGDKTATVS